MPSELQMSFIRDLAILLAVAAGVSLILGRLRLPMFMGYLIAGALVSTGFGFLYPLSNTENLKLWSEIGIIFLLFTIGLAFSLRDFAQLGSSSLNVVLFETLISLPLIGLILNIIIISWS